jgi:hypothetical protein
VSTSRPRQVAINVRLCPGKPTVTSRRTLCPNDAGNFSSVSKGSTAPRIVEDCRTCIKILGEDLATSFSLSSASRRLNQLGHGPLVCNVVARRPWSSAAERRRRGLGVSQGGDFRASRWMLNGQSRLEAERILLLGASRWSDHNRRV